MTEAHLVNPRLFPQAEDIHRDPANYVRRRQFGAHMGQRAVGAFFGPNIYVQLSPVLTESYKYAQDQFGAVGIDILPENRIIFDDDPRLARDFASFEFYQFEHNAFAAVHNHGLDPAEDAHFQQLQATELMNDKNRFAAFCRQHGHPVPKSIAVRPGEQPNIDQVLEWGLPLYIKVPDAANGRGLFRVYDMPQLSNALNKVHDKEYQIQQGIDVALSMSVQYYGGEDKIEHVQTTEQILNPDESHGGNIHHRNLDYDPRSVTDELAKDVVAAGVRGYMGFDVVVDHDGNYFVIEANARFTGATAPSLIAQRAGVGNEDWEARRFSTIHDHPSKLFLPESLRFDGKSGIVVVTNALTYLPEKDRAVDVLIVGPEDERAEMQVELTKYLTQGD